MTKREPPERFELRVTDIDDPLPDATFGSINRYVEVAYPDGADEPFVPQRLVLEFDEKQAEHVDPYSLMLFEVELESRTFKPVESSRVDVDGRRVAAWVDHPGTYGLIGLPTHPAVLETLRLLDRFGPQLLEERERGEHGLQDRICGLILCADPTMFGGGPLPPGDLCTFCLGLDPSFERLPERFLLEGRLPLRPLRELLEEEPPPPGTPSILAWGLNSVGQLGDGTRIDRLTPVWVPGLNARKIVGARGYTLALSTDGTVWSWGSNGWGVLGDGTWPSVMYRSSPGRVLGLTDVVDIAAGDSQALAVRSDGSVWMWGQRAGSWGSIDALPVKASGHMDAVAVAAGSEFILVLGRDGRVWSWGSNGEGQLGDGTRLSRATPALVPGLTAVRSIAAGLDASFAVRANGAVAAWGSGEVLGAGGFPDRLTPVAVPGLSNIEQVSASQHGLARTTAGEVWAWGRNLGGSIGDGTTNSRPNPVRVPGLQQITGIAAGGDHSVAFQANGTLWAWGSGAKGQVGDGGTADRLAPVAVPLPAGRGAAAVGAGLWTSFAVLG